MINIVLWRNADLRKNVFKPTLELSHISGAQSLEALHFLASKASTEYCCCLLGNKTSKRCLKT